MSNNIYGIDFGTCNFKVFSKSSGKVVSEKNTIAIINKTQIYAYGDDAYATVSYTHLTLPTNSLV